VADVADREQGERLTYDAPAGAMTQALLALLRQHKQELLMLLTRENTDWRAERLAIAVVDGKVPEPLAERMTPRQPGGLRLVDAQRPCQGCGSTELVQHVTYSACAACGQESHPEAMKDTRQTPAA
jgi:hypothetical protein